MLSFRTLFNAMCIVIANGPLFTYNAVASASDGVRCPSGYETRIDSAQKVMRCERSSVLYRPTVCDPATPEFFVYRSLTGRDFCVKPADATTSLATLTQNEPRRKNAACVSDNSEGLRWQIDVDASDERDRCRTTRTEWIYPSQQ
jgi:hypothetical protein